MKLITAARSQGISLTVASIFQKPQLSELSKVAVFNFDSAPLDSVQPKAEPFSLLPNIGSVETLKEEIAGLCCVDLETIQDIYPCTTIQEGLVALSNKSPGAYVAQNVYRLPVDIDLDRFRKSWDKVVEVEAILRTRIVYTESSGFLQVVIKEPISWCQVTSIHDIVGLDRLLPEHNGGSLSRYAIVNEFSRFPSLVWTVI
jgi:hypothetical protein